MVRPYWVRHPKQLAIITRLFAVLLIVLTPLLPLWFGVAKAIRTLVVEFADVPRTWRYLGNVVRHGVKAI